MPGSLIRLRGFGCLWGLCVDIYRVTRSIAALMCFSLVLAQSVFGGRIRRSIRGLFRLI